MCVVDASEEGRVGEVVGDTERFVARFLRVDEIFIPFWLPLFRTQASSHGVFIFITIALEGRIHPSRHSPTS